VCALAALMIASGSLLPYAAGADWRALLWSAHVGGGAGFAFALPWHIALARGTNAARSAGERGLASVGPLQRAHRDRHRPRVRA
jgi:hypothetical protein